jgi:hypothetical protein
MKKLYFLFAALLLTGFLGAQTYLSEDFSAGTMPPDGWYQLPLTTNWENSATSNAGGSEPECRFVGSQTTSTARLITPIVDLEGADTAVLMFKHNYIRQGTGLSIGVAYQDGGQWISVWEVTPNSNIDAEEVTILLTGDAVDEHKYSFYADGNFAACQSWYIDDILIFAPVEFDAQMSAILTPDVISAPEPVVGKIKNLGKTLITEASVSWVSYSGMVYEKTFTGLNLDLLEGAELEFDGSWVSPPGAHQLKMYINSINGTTDPYPENDTLTKTINYQTIEFPVKPVFEEFTSSTCAPCASFNSGFVPWCQQNADEISLIKYQMNWPGSGDPYYTAEGGTRRSYYGVNAVPDLFAQGDNIGASTAAAQNALNQAQGESSFYNIASTFTMSGTNINITTNILPFTTEAARVYNVIVEKLTTGNVASNGETEFEHVMMKMMPSASGSAETFTSGVPKQFTYTYDMSQTNVEEMDDLLVVVMIQNNSTKEIYQSGYGEQNAYFSDEARLSDITLDGVSLEGFDPDVFEYNVKLPVGTVEEPVLNGIPMDDGAMMIVNMAFAIPGTASIKVIAENLFDSEEYIINYSYDYVGEEENQKELISVYPNPANEILYFTGLNNSDVSILNASGRVIIEKNNFSGSSINIGNLSQGVYIVNIRTNDGQYMRKKIMVL